MAALARSEPINGHSPIQSQVRLPRLIYQHGRAQRARPRRKLRTNRLQQSAARLGGDFRFASVQVVRRYTASAPAGFTTNSACRGAGRTPPCVPCESLRRFRGATTFAAAPLLAWPLDPPHLATLKPACQRKRRNIAPRRDSFTKQMLAPTLSNRLASWAHGIKSSCKFT